MSQRRYREFYAMMQNIETDIDQCLGLLSVLLTHNDFDLLSQDDIQMCLSMLDEKLRKIKGGVGL